MVAIRNEVGRLLQRPTRGRALPPILSGRDETRAERAFHRAIDIAHRQSARSLELRSALSLGRLRSSQGKRTAARELVANIH